MDPTGLYTDRQVHYQEQQANNNAPRRDLTPEHTQAVLEQQLHKRNQKGWRKIVLNFTPSWFSVTMGTGIVSILLHKLPYNSIWLYWISVILFALNVLLFTTFTLVSIIRYAVYRGIFFAMLSHPVQSLFVGTFPMGLATIVNMMAFVCVPAWGPWSLTMTWAFWWIDVVISLACCMFLPFAVMHIHNSSTPKLQSMTAVWLLPVVSTIVASASGGIVAEALALHKLPTYALWTLVTSYILWGTGFPLAMVILVMYFHRLTVHRLPPREVIVSVFLPLGPLGQGGFAIMQLGRVSKEVFPMIHGLLSKTLGGMSGGALYLIGFVLALIMWGYGLVWLFFAIASVSRSKFPFNMGWWGFTFPLGVYAMATITIGDELPSPFFRVLGTIFSLLVVALWVLVTVKTAMASVAGTVFFAPDAVDFEKKWIQREIEAYGAEDLEARVAVAQAAAEAEAEMEEGAPHGGNAESGTRQRSSVGGSVLAALPVTNILLPLELPPALSL